MYNDQVYSAQNVYQEHRIIKLSIMLTMTVMPSFSSGVLSYVTSHTRTTVVAPYFFRSYKIKTQLNLHQQDKTSIVKTE